MKTFVNSKILRFLWCNSLGKINDLAYPRQLAQRPNSARINKVLQAQNERIKTLEHTLAHLLKTTSQTTSATNTPSKIPLQTQNRFNTRPPKTHATTPKTAIDPTHLNPWYAHHFTLATVSCANIPWRDNKAYRHIPRLPQNMASSTHNKATNLSNSHPIPPAAQSSHTSALSTNTNTHTHQPNKPNQVVFKPATPPQKPIANDHAPNWLSWFGTGNIISKVGVAILFLGLAFLLRLTSEYIPIAMRYLAVFLSGFGATALGLYLTKKRRDYGLILQGFGLAVSYLTLLAALKLSALISANTAFLLMVGVVIVKIMLAIRQNAPILAQIALIGGLAAPILTATGTHNYWILFGYLAILNSSIAIISHHKAWRSLNAISLAGTIFLVFLWQHTASLDTSARQAGILFGGYHLVLYTYMVLSYSKKQLNSDTLILNTLPNNATLRDIITHYVRFGLYVGVVDCGVLFGSALAGFLFLYTLIDGLALSIAKPTLWLSFGLASFYMVAAWLSWQRTTNTHTTNAQLANLPAQSLLLLAGMFVSLGIGLGFEPRLATGLWVLQAGLTYAFGLKQHAPTVRALALGLFLFGSIKWLGSYQLDGNFTVLGSPFGTSWLTVSGILVFMAWQKFISTPSHIAKPNATWERVGQKTGLILTLIHLFILPTLVASPAVIPWVLMALSLAVAVWHHRHSDWLVAIFLAVAGLWLVKHVHDTHTITQFASGLTLLAMAFSVHLPRQTTPYQHDTDFLAGIILILLSFIMLHTGFDRLLMLWLGDDDMLILWRVLLSFAVLTTVAIITQQRYRHWQPLSLILLSFSPLYTWLLIDTPSHIAVILPAVLGLILSLVIVHKQKVSAIHHNYLHAINLILIVIGATALFVHSDNAVIAHVWLAPALIIWATIHTQKLSCTKRLWAYYDWGVLLCFVVSTLWMVSVTLKTPVVIGTRLPLLNGVDILHLIIGVLFVKSRHAHLKTNHPTTYAQSLPYLTPLMAMLGLFAMSAVVVRTWHFYGELDWQWAILLGSFGLQASLSLVWLLLGIGLIVFATKHAKRAWWFVGMALLGVVVAKLFLVELGNSGGVARIISFIGVGIGLLLVGWLAPIPPVDSQK